MVSDNTKIIMGLSDTFSFEEYVSACSAKGLPPDNIGVFLQVAGMVEGGKRRNPSDSEAGYLEIVREMNSAPSIKSAAIVPSQPATSVAHTRSCGGCSGGRVR